MTVQTEAFTIERVADAFEAVGLDVRNAGVRVDHFEGEITVTGSIDRHRLSWGFVARVHEAQVTFRTSPVPHVSPHRLDTPEALARFVADSLQRFIDDI